MSEYSWTVKQIWFGVEGPKPELPMLGIIKRSGQVRALGHFCHVKISVNGYKVWASGAEDRIFYMHLVDWKDIGFKVPKDMIPAIGWCKDGNTYSFLHEGKIVYAGERGSLIPVDSRGYNDAWWKPADPRGSNVPLTLLERGAIYEGDKYMMWNHYIALMDERMQPKEWGQSRKPKPIVTLPVGCFNETTQEFEGLTGAVSMWNGAPPSWCVQVIEVKCDEMGWTHVKDEEIKELWSRTPEEAARVF